MITEPFKVICPHCHKENDAVSNDVRSFQEALEDPQSVIILFCMQCGDVFLFNNGDPRVISPEEWQRMPPEMRGELYRRMAVFQVMKKARFN